MHPDRPDGIGTSMTTQESFKKRVRARMERTGERYTTARQALLARSAEAQAERTRTWASEPEMAEAKLLDATGRGWEAWCDLIDAWPGHVDGHTAVAAHLRTEQGVDGWWAQTVTVGWERITGRRLPHQMADGTFTASRTRTVVADATRLRELLIDDDHRRDLFPDRSTELRSRPTSKVIRLGLEPGRALITLEPRSDGRTRVTVSHERLPTVDDVERWRFWWAEWLEAIDEG